METPDPFREWFRLRKALNRRIGVRTDGTADDGKVRWRLI